MGIEGRLKIVLRRGAGRRGQVQIDSSRPVHASRLFNGRCVAEALEMLPRLFSVCATAQACAGARVCEQALGMRPAVHREQLRDCLVHMETVREHLWRILLDWPAFVGESPEQEGMNGMLALQREHRRILTAGDDPFQLSGAGRYPQPAAAHGFLEDVGLVLGKTVFAMAPVHWLDIDRPETLEKWAATGTTVAARLLDHVMQIGWSDSGACEMVPLPFLAPARLNRAMQDETFVESPRWNGECCETSSLTRVDSRLLQRLRSRHGNGLLVRLVARLTELAQLTQKLLPDRTKMADEVAVSAQNPGIGRAAAARGELVHRVCVAHERIVSYQILAPTEWNFHPQGVVARSLASLQGERAQVEQQARLLINAIDPCVGYELSID